MKVFKITIGEYYYGIYSKDSTEAIIFLHEQIGCVKIDNIEEIPESEWDKKFIAMYEDNDTTKEPFFISIRDEIYEDEEQLVFTNDYSLID